MNAVAVTRGTMKIRMSEQARKVKYDQTGKSPIFPAHGSNSLRRDTENGHSLLLKIVLPRATRLAARERTFVVTLSRVHACVPREMTTCGK